MPPSDALIPVTRTPVGDFWTRLWRFAASARLAVLWIALIGLSLGLMALLPQMPGAALEDQAELARWLVTVRSQLGAATETLLNLGLLAIRQAPWFRLILAGAAFSLLIRLYTYVEALQQGREPPGAQTPDSFFADPHPHRSGRVASAPEQAIQALAARLKQRGYRVRTEAGGAAHYLVADRPLAPLGPLLAHLGLVLLLLGAAWNAVAAWEQAEIPLPPGEVISAGRGPTIELRLEDVSPQGQAQITLLASGGPVAQRTLAPGMTWWVGGLGVRLVRQGPAVHFSASDAQGASVMLLAAPGATPVPALTLLVTPDRPEVSAFVPAQALALQAEGRGAAAIRLRALRGTAGEPVAEEEITGEKTLTIDEVRYQVNVTPYVSVALIYLPGRLILIGGGLLTALGLLAWGLYRPRRIRALAALEGGATVIKIASELGPLPALGLEGDMPPSPALPHKGGGGEV